METKKLHDLSFEAICGIIAKVIHSANRAYVDAIGGRAVNLTWEEIREEERQGLTKAISNMIIDPQTPSVSHEQWCLAREKDGWSKDLKYDYNRKTHPNMVPYDQLPFEEQFKDHLFMGIASIFYGAMGLDDADEVKAARAFIRSKLAIEDPHVDVKIDVEDEIDPVDSEATIILKEKIKAAQDEIERLSGIPSDVRKDEEKPNLPDEPDQVINGVDKIYKPVMDIVDADGPDKPPPLPGEEGDLSRKVEGYVAGEEGYEDPNDNKLAVAPEMPLPTADEILAHKPKDYTAKDLAEDVLGADKVGEVSEDQAPKPGLPAKTIGPPKPNLPAKPKKKKKPAVKK